MVSVQLNMTEAAIPTKESHPTSLYKSTSSPVAAEEDAAVLDELLDSVDQAA